MSQYPIYLDYNATTPIRREVVEAMLPYLTEHFGNPSSAHPYGVMARQAVDRARGQVADLLGCSPQEVIFTSGGSEANNTALKGIAAARAAQGRHLITSAVEHPAISEPYDVLAGQGCTLTTLPVDGEGRADPADAAAALTPGTILVSIMAANNEVGTIQPVAAIAALAHAAGALVHVDAAQAVGKIPVTVDALGADLLSLAGHKLYAPKGVGALFVRSGVDLPKFMHGAGHEGGRRAGTENVAGIVALGTACAIVRQELPHSMAHMAALRDRLYARLREAFPPGQMRVNGPSGEGRLPNTLSVSFRGVEANALLAHIGTQVAASAGAACHAGEVRVSHVLAAMGVPLDYAMGTVRLSVGTPTTADEIETAAAVIIGAVRAMQP